MGKNQHGRKLLPSSVDLIVLAMTVEIKFVELCGTYKRIHEVDLIPPPDMDSDLLRWRQMRVRHKCKRCKSGVIAMDAEGGPMLYKDRMPMCGSCGRSRGDYRHTAAEEISVRNVAEWTVLVDGNLRKQTIDINAPVNWVT